MTPEDAARLAVQVQVILLFPEISKEDQTFLTALAFVRLSTYCVLNFTDKKRSSREQEEDRQDSEILFMDAVTVVRQSSWLTDLSNDHREILESEFLTVPFVEKP